MHSTHKQAVIVYLRTLGCFSLLITMEVPVRSAQRQPCPLLGGGRCSRCPIAHQTRHVHASPAVALLSRTLARAPM